ncbi:MAG: methylglutaconyl-CoA hydratase [Chlorobiaceae bacterium]|nr:methylglutaconyl-CoA hydratase [Chlorobiaceae bacterium]MBA4308782.1 methylglutaconyl-CoA hydratase [Chlorobiaceae bacterium]
MIISEIKNNVGIILLNRPEKRNSLNPELIEKFIEAFHLFEINENVKSIIISGEGKSFCAGADLSYLKQLQKLTAVENWKDSENISKIFLKIYECNKTVIAVVNGSAFAGGCGLATACDYIFADSISAKFGYTEVRIGFLPAIVSFLLVKRIGEVKARQLLISGKILSAAEALKINLIDSISITPMEDALTLANEISANSSYSINQTKKMIREISNMSYVDAVNYCINLNVISRSSDDFKNGLNNF